MYTFRRYKWRFWAVYCGAALVCVTVYRKGAREVARRLNSLAVPSMEGNADAS